MARDWSTSLEVFTTSWLSYFFGASQSGHPEAGIRPSTARACPLMLIKAKAATAATNECLVMAFTTLSDTMMKFIRAGLSCVDLPSSWLIPPFAPPGEQVVLLSERQPDRRTRKIECL